MSDGEAAGGVSRGGRIFVAPPLDRLLLVLFLAKQEKYIPYQVIAFYTQTALLSEKAFSEYKKENLTVLLFYISFLFDGRELLQ